MKIYCEDCKHYYYDRYVYSDECTQVNFIRIDVQEFESNPIHKPYKKETKVTVRFEPREQNKNNNCQFFINRDEKKEKQSTLKNLIKKIKEVL